MLNVLENSEFLDGAVNTDFIKENPQLFDIAASQNRAQKLLHYLGNVMINGAVTPLATDIKPSKIEPKVPKVSKVYDTNSTSAVFAVAQEVNLKSKSFIKHEIFGFLFAKFSGVFSRTVEFFPPARLYTVWIN